jgi:tRNA A-37 threonylcarbamoyl transferase component Bud32
VGAASAWYQARGKQKVGPHRWEELRALAARGELRRDEMVWQEGTPRWRRADTVPGLFADLPAAPAVPGYELLEELGRGGMGVVYKARQTALKRLVALKMILHADHAGPEERRRFRAEAEAVARLQHPNIVTVHETGEHGGAPFFSLEYCPGGSLSKRLAGAPQPPRAAAKLVETLARAVHAAHQAGVVHRDLKPANVLLAADGAPKVADFGLAKSLDRDAGQTRSGAVLGTPSYMAPEQAAGRARDVGPAADVYALGAILYEMLTGRPPFRGASAAETLEMVRRQPPVPPRRLGLKVPRDLETVCLKCLEKEPRQRYASAAELADDLRRFLNTEPIRARRVGATGRAWRWCRRHRLPAALLVLAASALVVYLVYLQTRSAYLDVRATPADAEVTLDGTPLSLTAGRALVTRSPGRHLLRVTAEGYEGQEQPVVLVRGRGNAAVVHVQLVSTRGRLEVHTSPERAPVKVTRAAGGPVVGQGTAPCEFHLPAGDYVVACADDLLYKPAQAAVQVPNGDRRVAVTLPGEPVDPDSVELLTLMKRLREPWEGTVVMDDPKAPLREVLGRVAGRLNLPLLVRDDAFRAEQVQDVLDLRVCERPIRLRDASVGTWLRVILARVPTRSGAVVVPRGGRGNLSLELTTRAAADAERLLLLHPVRDLTTGPNAIHPPQLAHAVKSAIAPGPADFAHLPGAEVLQVSAPWRVHEAIDAYLTQLRKARKAPDPAAAKAP